MNYTNPDIINYLRERGLIAQITNEKALRSILQLQQPITLYCGFDPTSDSLHIGHLAPLLCLRRFQSLSHRPIIVLGGATGLIGDPSFRVLERPLNSFNVIHKWAKKIKSQISSFIDCNSKQFSRALILDNYSWFSSMNILTFLRDTGKFFSINKMINKEIIKKRLQQNNCSISYTEFSYNLMQSYDFAYLYENYKVILQIGGSDQWGNIVSGIDLIRRIHKKPAYGLTVPLIMNTNKTKFGKTEKETIWLDPDKTSPYKFYQYWVNADDEQVYYFLQLFTDIDIKTINSFKDTTYINSGGQRAQVILAETMTRLVHGNTGLKVAQRITRHLFSNSVLQLTATDFNQLVQDGIPTVILKSNTIQTLQQSLVESKLATSRTNAKELIASSAISLNSRKQLNPNYTFQHCDRLYNTYSLLKRGKKYYCLILWEHDF